MNDRYMHFSENKIASLAYEINFYQRMNQEKGEQLK